MLKNQACVLPPGHAPARGQARRRTRTTPFREPPTTTNTSPSTMDPAVSTPGPAAAAPEPDTATSTDTYGYQSSTESPVLSDRPTIYMYTCI